MRKFAYIILVLVVLGSFASPRVYAEHEPGHVTTGLGLLQGILDELTNPSATSTSISTGFSRDGVYGCTGASYGSVGMQGPGGAHVPTFDDAVFDQEKLLTYKECLLDGIVNSMRETLISFIIQSVVRWTNTGFDGNPAYPTNIPLYYLEGIADPVTERVLTGPETEVVSGPFRRDVRVALAKDYSETTRNPQNRLECAVSDQKIEAFMGGDFYGGGGWDALFNLSSNSSCNPVFAYYNARDYLNRTIASAQNLEQTKLDQGSGFRTVERDQTIDLGSGQTTTLRRIVTPGFMIAEHIRQVIGTGLRQSENADEIDEIISALMANIGTEMLTDIQGLSGLSSSFGGRASYVDRVAADSAARTRGNLTGAGASVIDNTIRVEQEYTQTRQASVATLIQSRKQLETWENTCWSGIIEQAKTDLRERVRNQACPQQSSNNGSSGSNGNSNNTNSQNQSSCSVSVSITENVALDAIGIRVPNDGTITVEGRASKGDSIVDVAATNSGTTIGPIQPTVTTNGNWVTPAMDLSTLEDGAITVSATETLSGSAGVLAPIIAIVQKLTTITGIELTPPTEFPAITITASGGGVTQSATFVRSVARSRAIVNQNVTPILTLLRENIVRSATALQVLTQLHNALASTTSASGQRFILERLDQLVVARVLHTEAQLRQARDQSVEIEGAMQQLLEETREGWEASWCDPDNWEQSAN